MIEPVLLLSGVTHGRRLVDVSLALVPGEVAGLVGPPGAGKSTLLRIVAGLIAPDAGTVTVAGRPVRGGGLRRAVGYVPAVAAWPAALTVRELLGYAAGVHAAGVRYANPPALAARAIARTDAGGLAGRRVGSLAPGEWRRIALAQAVLGERAVLLLDETLSGLDPVARRDLRGVIARLAAAGAAVLIAATDPVVLDPLVARAFVLRAGRIVRAGPLGGAGHAPHRVLEVILDRPPPVPPPGFRVTAAGLEAPLDGRTPEAALALCRAHRLAVRATRVRIKSLEELVLDAHDRGS